MEKKELRPYHGVIALVLCAITIFGISPMLGRQFGIYGSAIAEIMILIEAVLVVVIARGDMKRVFPLHRPKLLGLLGTALMWAAVFVSVMTVTLLLTYFFPEQVAGASGNLGAVIMSTPMMIAMLIISLSPAICEEAVFRGVFLNSLKGIRQKWIIIIVVGSIFGAFHGSIWKFIPTAALGMLMTYIVLETDNMIYSAVLHLVNNLVPILMLGILKGSYEAVGGVETLLEAQQSMQIPLASVGVYFIFAAGMPLIFYIGRYCLRRSVRGYEGGLFTKEQVKPVLLLVFIGALLAIAGISMIVFSLIFEQNLYSEMMKSVYSGNLR